MMLLRNILLLFWSFSFSAVFAQTLGGNAVFSFVRLPSSPMLTAMGGVNTSYRTDEVGITSNNPSLLHSYHHSQVNLSFNSFPGGIKTYSLTGALRHSRLNTVFGGHIYFVDYGSIPNTDAAGNELGSFRPVDFVIQVSAARSYLEKWNYGASLKLLRSALGPYRSTGLAVDAAVHYSDTARQFFASVLAKNMGAQVTTYTGEHEDLPFDFQLGITKKLEKAPFGFSFTAQHLHRFNIRYQDTLFNNANEFENNNSFITRLLNHFVVAGHVYLGKHLEAAIGYNHLRRSELNIGASGNGLNGFSMGVRVQFSKLQFLYARSAYQRNISYNQLGLTMNLNKFFGPGSL